LRHVRAVVERLGLPEGALAGLAFAAAPEAVFVGTPEVMEFAAIRPLRRGMRFCRVFPHSIKPTSHAMQLLGRHASRNRVEVGEEQAVTLANGGEIRIEAECEDGFVVVCWRGFVLGTGLYKRPVLKSQIPRFRPVG
jgi:NOL1/NOP2/fmu family ribosome biogenesis protein